MCVKVVLPLTCVVMCRLHLMWELWCRVYVPVHTRCTCAHMHTHSHAQMRSSQTAFVWAVCTSTWACDWQAHVTLPWMEWGIQRSCFGVYAATWLQIQTHLHKLTLFKIDFDGHGTGELNGVCVSWCLIGLLLVQSGSCLSSVDNICRWGGWEGPEKDSAYLCPCILYIKYWLRFHTVLCCVKVLGSVVVCSDQH